MISLTDLQWAAGFLEGEGSFHGQRRAHIAATQVQKWPLLKLQAMFGGRFYLKKSTDSRWSDAWMWWCCGPRAAGILMTLYPLLSPRRQEQIRVTLTGWRSTGVGHAKQTHCLRGHEFNRTWTNPRTGRVMRQCGECHKLTRRDYYHKRIADGNPIGGRSMPGYRKRRSAVGASGVV